MLGNHYLGIYEKAFDPQDGWAQRLKKAKEIGFDFLELSVDEQSERIQRLYWEKTQIEDFRRMCLESGVRIPSMCLSCHRLYPFGSADPDKRRKAYELMERAIEFSVLAGIRVIQLAGYDVYYEPSTAKSREAFLKGLRWAAKRAEKNSVMLGMEIMDTDYLNSITKYLWFEEQIESPWFRVYPDLGNLTAWGNDVCSELRKGIQSIVAVHLKDTQPVTQASPGRFKRVPFGQGTVDFKVCFSLLERLGYNGPYMIEMWYDGNNDVDTVLSAKRYIEKQFSLSEECIS